MRTLFPRTLLAIILLVSGCNLLPGGLTIGTGQTLKGKISGTGLGGKTKVGVMSGSFVPSDMTKAQVVGVGSDGIWSYDIPVGQNALTVFAFVDANGNGQFDRGEVNSYESCPSCSYVYASLVGDTWKVSIKRSGTSSDTALAGANIQFDA